MTVTSSRLCLDAIILFATILMSSVCLASSITGPYQIRSIIVGGYGAHIEVTPAPPGCVSNWAGTQFVIISDASNYKDLLAGVLAAQAEGKPVMAWHDPQGDGTCSFSNQLIINTLQIKS